MDDWKAFETGQVTHSVSHYLAAIDHLGERQGYARSVDVARHLSVTRGSVSLALKSLKGRGLVVEDHNRFLSLSEEGQQIVDRIRARRRLVQAFFEDMLGVDPAQAESDACKIEHLLSDQVYERLDAFVKKGSRRRGRARRPARQHG